jgi:hypothetical protein
MLAQAAANEAKAAHEDAKQARALALTAVGKVQDLAKRVEQVPAIHLLATAINNKVNADKPDG